MRLLHTSDFTFRQFWSTEIPPYAILSHRWRENEARLADIERWRNTPAIENTKVYNFAQYVKAHFAVEWIWVDSCCINQGDNAELSEGVNSMFAWYKKAAVCVTYLPDVDDVASLDKFSKSVWFERGWTLQELVASDAVLFLTSSWQLIGYKGRVVDVQDIVGDRPNLETIISMRTNITLDVLADFSKSRALSTRQKLRWMEGRKTLREEDKYYALFGIFGVAPGANYGEGRERAERRLLEAIQREEDLKYGNVHDHKLFADVTTWIGCPDPWTNYDSARRLHETGTCEWFLRSSEYGRWLDGNTKHLWLHGKPGCGKTVLCSSIIANIEAYCENHSQVGLGIFYFAYNDVRKQAYEDLLRALIKQWGWREPAMSSLRKVFEHPSRKRLAKRELEEIVIAAMQPFNRVLLVIDALDESTEQAGVRYNLLKSLERLAGQRKVQLLITSRYLMDIKHTMTVISAKEIAIEPKDLEQDIETFVKTQLLTRLRDFAPGVKATIEQNIFENANGMFRWVALLTEALSRPGTSSIKAVERVLTQSPTSLDEVYAQSLREISLSEGGKREALVLLQWLAYAHEPLTLDQLSEALIIRPDQDEVDVEDRRTSQDILKLLPSLIEVIDLGQEQNIGPGTKIRLAHSSIKHYLQSKRIKSSDVAYFHLDNNASHYLLEQSCITYLIHCSDNRRITTPLRQYAIDSWYKHMTAITDRSTLNSNNQNPLAKLFEEDGKCRGPHDEDCGNPLQAAAAKGHADVVKLLLSIGVDVNVKGGHYGRPLIAACAEGHIDVARLLLKAGADVHAKGGLNTGTPLGAAASKNHVSIVRLLLSRQVDVNASGCLDDDTDNYSPALSIAAENGNLDVMRLLLGAGADPNQQGGSSGAPLLAAAGKGQMQAVELLLDRGALVNLVCDSQYGHALQAASRQGHLLIVKLLLRKGADVNKKGGFYGGALQAAAALNQFKVAQELLFAGALIDQSGGQHGQALQAACIGGHLRMVHLLLDEGADISFSTGHFGDALQAAAGSGRKDIVQVLLDSGADLHKKKGLGSALHATAREGSADMIEFLLAKGARLEATNSDGLTPLALAAQAGHTDNVRTLLAAGAKLYNPASNRAKTIPLHRAIDHKHFEVVKLLLDAGSDIEMKNSHGQTALNRAADKDDLQIIKLLLDSGADIDSVDRDGNTPILNAMVEGHLDTVKLLFDAGANMCITNQEGASPLFFAAGQGCTAEVELFLKAGVQYGLQDSDFSPLLAATLEGHLDIIKILVAAGADINERSHEKEEETLLHAACTGEQLAIVEYFVANGMDINVLDAQGRSPLFWAAGNGSTEIARYLIDAGADLTIARKDGWRALHSAAAEGHVAVARLLVGAGFDVNLGDKDGDTPLHVSAFHNNFEVVDLLLKAGADAQLKDLNGSTPLHCAAKQGNLKILQPLIDHGAKTDALDEEQRSSIYLAAWNGYTEAVEALLVAQADAELTDAAGWTPLSMASQIGHVDVVKLLLNKVDHNTANKQGYTALIAASSQGHVEIVKMLLRTGADVEAHNMNRETALFLACANGHASVVGDLLKVGADAKTADGEQYSPLLMASQNGHVEVVRQLLDHGLDPTITSDGRGNPLRAAAKHGKIEVIRLFLANSEYGISLGSVEDAIRVAMTAGHENVVTFLMPFVGEHRHLLTKEPESRRQAMSHHQMRGQAYRDTFGDSESSTESLDSPLTSIPQETRPYYPRSYEPVERSYDRVQYVDDQYVQPKARGLKGFKSLFKGKQAKRDERIDRMLAESSFL